MNSPFISNSPFFNQNSRYNSMDNNIDYYHPEEDYYQDFNNNRINSFNNTDVNSQIITNNNENSSSPYKILKKYQTALNNNYTPNGYSLRQYKTQNKNNILKNSINVEDNPEIPNSNKINNPSSIFKDNFELKDELNTSQNPKFHSYDISNNNNNINNNNVINNIKDNTQNNEDMDIDDNNTDQIDNNPSTDKCEDKSTNINSTNDIIHINEFRHKGKQENKKEDKEVDDDENKIYDSIINYYNNENIKHKKPIKLWNKKWYAVYKGRSSDLMMKYVLYNRVMDECNKENIANYAIGSNDNETIFYFEIKKTKTYYDINENSFLNAYKDCFIYPTDNYIFLEKRCENKYLYYTNMDYYNELNKKISENKKIQDNNTKDEPVDSNDIDDTDLNNISNDNNYLRCLWILEPEKCVIGLGEKIISKYIKDCYEKAPNDNWNNYSNQNCVIVKIKKSDINKGRILEIIDLLDKWINNNDNERNKVLSQIKYLIVICEVYILKSWIKDIDRFNTLFNQFQYFNLIYPKDVDMLNEFIMKTIDNE